MVFVLLGREKLFGISLFCDKSDFAERTKVVALNESIYIDIIFNIYIYNIYVYV